MSVTGEAVPETKDSEERQYVVDDFEAELLADLEDVDHQVGVFAGRWTLSSERSPENNHMSRRPLMNLNSHIANGKSTKRLAPQTFPTQLGTDRQACWGNSHKKLCCECLASYQLKILLFLHKLAGTWLL